MVMEVSRLRVAKHVDLAKLLAETVGYKLSQVAVHVAGENFDGVGGHGDTRKGMRVLLSSVEDWGKQNSLEKKCRRIKKIFF